MALDENISGLIGRLYEGAFDTAIWDRAIEDVLAQTGSRFALIATLDARRHDFVSTAIQGRMLDGVLEEYSTEAFLSDPSYDFVVSNPQARFFDSLAHLGPDDYLNRPFVRWCMERCRTSHWVAGYTPEGDGFHFAASFHSDQRGTGFSASEGQLVRLLFDHMERAQRIAARPPDLDHAEKATILIDALGRVHAMSSAAERLIADEPALVLRDHVVRPAATSLRARWDALIGAALSIDQGGVGGAMPLQRSRGRPLLITIDPLPVNTAGHRPTIHSRSVAMIRIVDPDAGTLPGATARGSALFNLTTAEARLAEALLLTDCHLGQAAEHCGVTYATARTQLAAIFRKTDTHGQPELVRLLTLAGG